jgi:hypothetical protein
MGDTIQCVICGAARLQPLTRAGRPRVPAGWKVFGQQAYCRTCTRQAYVLRTITVPIASPLDHSWAEFREALRAAWVASTACANWMTTELYLRDVRREPSMTTLPKMPRVYLYPEARRRFPVLTSGAVVALERELQAKYRALRYELLWTGSRSLATHRYPYPLPISAGAWSLELLNDAWHAAFRLGEERWTVRLRGGPSMRHQIAGLRQILNGTAVRAALAIYQRQAHRGDHRPEGARPHTRVMLRVPAWFPREVRRDTSGVLRVQTDPAHFVVAVGPDKSTWTVNADHVRRWVMAYDRQRERLMTDVAAHGRNKHPSPGIGERLHQLATRHRLRMSTWAHTVSRQVVDHAVRRRCAGILYDDTERRYVRSFPWDVLRQHMQEKAEQAGMNFSRTRNDAGVTLILDTEQNVSADANGVKA